VLIMQRMGFIKGPLAPTESGRAAYDLMADDAEALDELFPAIRPHRRKAAS
jgi:hypothetical protein